MLKPELKNLPIDCLVPGKYQTRNNFTPEALQELATSIQAKGLIQPIIVKPLPNNNYAIVAGERRWRAAQLAKLDTVPCIINHYDEEQTAAVTAIENIQREDLNPIEEAKAYQRLIDEFDYTHEEVAEAVGKSRAKITNLLRLLKLDARVQSMLIEGRLSEGHGKIIAGLAFNLQYEFALQSVKHGWSARRIEEEAKRLQATAQKEAPQADPDIKILERKIAEQLGSQVKIEADLNDRSGWLKIKYFNNEILAGILDKLAIDYD